MEPLPALDHLLDPITRVLPREALRELVDLRADQPFQDRLDLLADRNTEGLLTPDERGEYETYVQAVMLLGILKSKARKRLAEVASG